MATIKMAGRRIGPGCPVWIVAELSGNHHRDYSTAVALIHAAKEAGADAVKTQCFTPDSMTLPLATPPFRLVWNGRERTLHDLYAETAMPLAWHAPLKALAESLGLVYFASVFDRAGVDLLHALDVPCFKIASFELTDLPLIRYAAGKDRPLLLSTGMATWDEIRAAVAIADEGLRDRVYVQVNRALMPPTEIALLKCTSAYPASPADANLNTLRDLRAFGDARRNNVAVGLSDHTQSNAVAAAAVALGAVIVERHLKLSPDDDGPDSRFSDTPEQFRALVTTIRETEAALGRVRYGPTAAEQPMLRFRRSLWVVADVQQGEPFTEQNVRVLRPTGGLPTYYDSVLDCVAARDCRAGEPLTEEMVQWSSTLRP